MVTAILLSTFVSKYAQACILHLNTLLKCSAYYKLNIKPYLIKIKIYNLIQKSASYLIYIK